MIDKVNLSSDSPPGSNSPCNEVSLTVRGESDELLLWKVTNQIAGMPLMQNNKVTWDKLLDDSI